MWTTPVPDGMAIIFVFDEILNATLLLYLKEGWFLGEHCMTDKPYSLMRILYESQLS